MRTTFCFRQFTSSPVWQINKGMFVPKHEPVAQSDIAKLEEFLRDKSRILVLTGAGISTESGIPDYRSEGVGLYARSNSRPIQHPDFVKYADVRKRYWARNYVGWPRFSSIEPNAIHHTLARFEREGRILGIVTQNVDCLHNKAGSRKLIEIHGNGYTVICLSCDYSIPRHDFQDILNSLNPTQRALALKRERKSGREYQSAWGRAITSKLPTLQAHSHNFPPLVRSNRKGTSTKNYDRGFLPSVSERAQ
uniref:Deacetylase sirtuin-type domain-containing protein n=1 Tax=Phlebotomus papatasi TaxID=29031 RepID=A0A1B0DJC8_PHLPP